MQQAGVQRVVSMLSDSELQTYAEPLPAAMEAAFGEGNYINVDAKAPGESTWDTVGHGLDLINRPDGCSCSVS